MRSFRKALILLLSGFAAGCDKPHDAGVVNEQPEKNTVKQQNVTVTVFAAASLTESLTMLGNKFQEKHPGIRILFNFDSSGTLKRQIEEGVVSDIFISAAPKQMNELENGGRVLSGSRIDLLENKVTLAVPENNQYQFNSFGDLAEKLHDCRVPFAVGNADVPVGQYSQKIFSYLGLKQDELEKMGCLSYGSNVKEVTTQISEGMVMAGIVYATDAVSAKLTVVDTATEQMCGRVIYPAALLKNTGVQTQAQDFLNYLSSEDAKKVFEQIGFTLLKK